MAGLRTLRAIVQGFKNYHFPNEQVEKQAKERAIICASCKHANHDHPFKLLLQDNSTKEIKGLGCDICHCLLSALVRQYLKSCPIKKWE